MPVIFVVALPADSTGNPEEVAFGDLVRETGLAIRLVCLTDPRVEQLIAIAGGRRRDARPPMSPEVSG